MKTIFLMFVIFVDSNGFESLETVNDVQFSLGAECRAELEHYQNTKNIYFFCGDADLYVSKEPIFY